MSSEKDLLASAAQAAFANQAPSSIADQDALLIAKIQQNNAAPAANVDTGDSGSKANESSNEANNTASTPDTPTGTKSFEDYIVEKTGGKHKSWEEIDSLINNPNASAPKYNSEIAEKVDKYIASGGTIDENWFKKQTTDYSAVENPIDLFREQMKLKNPEMSEVEIEYEINERYKLDQWEDDDDSSLQQAMSAKIAREANEARKFLVENQEKSSIFNKGKTPEQVDADNKLAEQITEEAKQFRTKFDGDVRAAVSEIEKLQFTPIEGFEIDYVLSSEEKEAVSNVVSSLYDGSTKMLEPYLTKNGDQITGIDLKALATKLAKAEIFDSVLKKVAQESKAQGALNIVKNQKNINFSADSKSGNEPGKTMDSNSVIAAHFASKL